MFTEITCLLCNWNTKDSEKIDYINGAVLGGNCPECEGNFWKWENESEVRVTLNGEYLESEKN